MSEEEEQFIRCEECREKRATVHLTDLVSGEAVAHHYCQECYAEKEGQPAAASFFQQLLEALAPELEELEVRNCPACGINYLEFRQSMQLGCPNDYEVFEKPLEQLLERIHGATRHIGKVPAGVGQQTALRTRLRGLKKRQEEAIAREDYELAADLRDRISELETDESGKS